MVGILPTFFGLFEKIASLRAWQSLNYGERPLNQEIATPATQVRNDSNFSGSLKEKIGAEKFSFLFSRLVIASSDD